MSPPLRLYNTLTRSKGDFCPIDPANVRLYVCGPTIYDNAHIGNARPLIVFDVLYRLLRHHYGADHVTYVRNITDVDDKINARAAEEGVPIRDLTERTNRVFQGDVRALGCLEPNHQPRATEFVAKPDAPWDMIRMIARLIERGHAYAVDGHVLFSVPSMPDYGRLSRRPLDEMVAGARVEVAPYKRGDTDFVLWKPSREGEPGWQSPWGFGRPGWHIECSAMSAALLGETFDIHGGGIDLVFPHHENEIAQSRCCFGAPVMANVWMHNGFLQVEGEKMSKSLGNFVTIHDLLHTTKFGGRSWSGEVLRLAMLKTHYRQPIDWTVKALEEAEKTLLRWRNFCSAHDHQAEHEPFLEALNDDLNVSAAIAEMHGLASTGFEIDESEVGETPLADDWGVADAAARLRACLDMLGLSRVATSDWNATQLDEEKRAQVEACLEARRSARATAVALKGDRDAASKHWAESDRIRDELAGMGIALKDNKDGTTTWEVKR